MAHYTSASNAIRIIDSKCLTLRNAMLMNDFSEIRHGESCLSASWASEHGKGTSTQPGRLLRIFNKISPTIIPAVEQRYDNHLSQRKTDTFIISLAEHNEQTEGQLGRLSMWRAYGGQTNVALIFNPPNTESEASTGLFSAPVVYKHRDDFVADVFSETVSSIESNIEELLDIDRDELVDYLSWTLNVMALSAKHPGFMEEKEWRVIYAPWLYFDASIKDRIVDIQGVPQKTFQVDLSEQSGKAGVPAFGDLLNKVIIGPTEHPWVLYETFVMKLEKAGLPDAATKVVVSDIPIRR